VTLAGAQCFMFFEPVMKCIVAPDSAVLRSRPQNMEPVNMAKKAKRREWTKDDVRELKTLARQKTPVAKIAKSLKRTPGATQQKAFSLGVSLDTRG
jgi:hypothetical protein